MLLCDRYWLALAITTLLITLAHCEASLKVLKFAQYPDFVQDAWREGQNEPGRKLHPRQQAGASCRQDKFLEFMKSSSGASPFCASFMDFAPTTSISTVYPTV